MRDLLFLVADSNMEFAIRGFFEREHWNRSIGCATFDFDPGKDKDIRVATGANDPGLYSRAVELLRPFSSTYRRVVVMVDEEWEGSPGAEDIQDRIKRQIHAAGWNEKDGLALVLVPEVDIWLWSPSPHVAVAMGWKSWAELREAIQKQPPQERPWFPNDQPKPQRPKEAAEWALRQKGKARSSSVYREITSKISIGRCKDPALRTLVERLRTWFPADEP